ncbi:MAG: hypothetical protein DSZ33_01015, partial [Gammaproteobacteria bacterium]
GGKDGKPGCNRLLRQDGTVIELDACAEFDIERGDRVEIQTPGGGGYGEDSEE